MLVDVVEARSPTETEAPDRLAARWWRTLAMPDWYVRLEEELHRYVLAPASDPFQASVRRRIYDVVEEALRRGRVSLATEGEDQDAEREPVRVVVLHHSGTVPWVTSERLSAMGLLRLYAPVYLQCPARRGRPIYSHHRRGGRPVFYAYHWLVRPNGTAERLLHDGEVGWHAGDWAVNRASVGVCVAGDHSSVPPRKPALERLRLLLARYPNAGVVPHCRVNPGTCCPGPWAA